MDKFSVRKRVIFNVTLLFAVFIISAQLKGQKINYMPFYKDARGAVYLHQVDRMTTACLLDINCDKKIWLKVLRSDKSYSLSNVTLKCIPGEIRFDYAMTYNTVGKRVYEEKKNITQKISPNTIMYELYSIYCED